MEPYRRTTGRSGEPRLEVPYRGTRLLRHPIYNKGTAFTSDERQRFGLSGLLPHAVSTMEQQARRFERNLNRKTDALEKYIGLSALQDRNETLFYRVLVDNLEALLPIIYTPTVGLACEQYSHIFRQTRGLWITPAHRGHIADVLRNASFEDIRLIVVTDNERILGLGDQGAGGMGIPIGKLAIYTAGAGIHPTRTLPISLDVGTDNKALLIDDLYLGWRQPRLRGEDYDSLIDEFVHAVRAVFPECLLQWEDFKKGIAFRLLERYRKALPSFNDDIQGTAAVTVAGILAGCRATGTPLTEQRIVILGAGAAGIGITRQLRDTLRGMGLADGAIMDAIAVLDSQGLLVDDAEIRDAYKRPFAWPADLARRHGLGTGAPRDLLSVVRAVHPTVLIGTSGQAGVFDAAVVTEMARHAERPIVLPLSNPTSNSEATPADVIRWTGGRALVATGSPFAPVSYEGKTIRIGQGNNAFIFPGVGLGCIVSRATEVTDAMFAAAAHALAGAITNDDLGAGSLYPRVSTLRSITRTVATAVVRAARDTGAAQPMEDSAIDAAITAAMWEPRYLPYDAI